VALLAQTEAAFGHACQGRIHFVQQTGQVRVRGCDGNRRLQSALAIFQLILQESGLYRGHHNSPQLSKGLCYWIPTTLFSMRISIAG
jgi:hypothetical protein